VFKEPDAWRVAVGIEVGVQVGMEIDVGVTAGIEGSGWWRRLLCRRPVRRRSGKRR
jgi:hypothetical protein